MIDNIATLFKTNANNAKVRILKLKLGPTCGRCGGSGQYSYNHRDGTTCWGCNGHGVTLPNTSGEWVATEKAAQEALEDGRHQAYLDRLAAQRRSKKGWDRAMEAWQRLEALNGYTAASRKCNHATGERPDRWDEIKARNDLGYTLCTDLQALDKGKNTDWIAYDERLTKGLAEIEAAIKELE